MMKITNDNLLVAVEDPVAVGCGAGLGCIPRRFIQPVI